ncbi:CBS domain-containing protein [Sorangium sp. So ce1151]|uniref:CBS domain-containing protein n=1 Tax=Sorangium sp. So ce1151 TaxID=3133332 RepID=UPI003F6297FF
MVDKRRELDGLEAVAALVRQGEEPEITGRQLLSWFGAARRGTRVVARIDGELLRLGLMTEPDFKDVWVDVAIRVKPLNVQAADSESEKSEEANTAERPAEQHASTSNSASPAGQPETKAAAVIDPVPRIGGLPAASKPIVSVRPGTSLNEAMTLMMLRDFSQLPVLQSERECKGAISWQSIATTTALGRTCETVNDCISAAEEVSYELGLLDAIPKIAAAGFVLVRGPDRIFQGIVTVADLSLQFRTLTEPFLLLGQIENMLRILIARSFELGELRQAKNPADTSRVINSVSDLNFGEYVGLLEPAKSWPKLGVRFDRGPFLADLRKIHELRNDVMHFDPDPLGDAEMALLRNFAIFLERVV